ncbi:MAG: glycerophosphodiester phosphodiesterase [Alphaproteobacteria bacterium]|nr:glycerophosphodiester phosphodiesterase [Alphaproteobacteria bacterium]
MFRKPGEKLSALAIAAALALWACGKPSAPPVDAAEDIPGWRMAPQGDLPGFFACLRKEGVTLVAAHRGGPADGYPENAIETFAHTLSLAPAIIETDVAETADGVLYLMHDDRLERTTTGEGATARLDWDEIRDLHLEDPAGAKTQFTPPRFDAALAWAEGRAILEIDIKPSASYAHVIKTIVNQNAADRVILIAPSLGAARKLNRLAPDAMISIPIDSISELNRAVAEDIPMGRIIAFSRDADAAPRLLGALREQGAITAFATLEGADSTDREMAFSGEGGRYAVIAAAGADIIATDRPVAAAAALDKAGRGAKAGKCGISKD